MYYYFRILLTEKNYKICVFHFERSRFVHGPQYKFPVVLKFILDHNYMPPAMGCRVDVAAGLNTQ